jgi:hypothetical protein
MPDASPLNARQGLETELRKDMQRAHQEWREAPEWKIDQAQLRFLEAQRVFRRVVLGKEPDGG